MRDYQIWGARLNTEQASTELNQNRTTQDIECMNTSSLFSSLLPAWGPDIGLRYATNPVFTAREKAQFTNNVRTLLTLFEVPMSLMLGGDNGFSESAPFYEPGSSDSIGGYHPDDCFLTILRWGHINQGCRNTVCSKFYSCRCTVLFV